jgi:hypothetical protein
MAPHTPRSFGHAPLRGAFLDSRGQGVLIKPARASDTTVFRSVGLAIEDVAAARLVYEAAREA